MTKKPIHRSALRLRLGMLFYGALRRLLWVKQRRLFATAFQKEPLPFTYASHQTILMRKLKDVDMWLQRNKVTNLRIAAKRVDGILLRPGEVLSYWRLIGKPTKGKGYLPGMVLRNGSFAAGTGGGLCQLSNLIFWMTLHTPLDVIERHRHGYDVFPDSNRTQPFGSGATCFYPHGDLMIQNNTPYTFQLVVSVGEEFLEGEWRADAALQDQYRIVERDHAITCEPWGGYRRHNVLEQQRLDGQGTLLETRVVAENTAVMMYEPFLPEHSADQASQ